MYKYLFMILLSMTKLYAESGVFYGGVNELPSELKFEKINETAASVKSFSMKADDSRGRCSLVYISHSGYALTARHCLTPNLAEIGAAKAKQEGNQTILEIDQEKIKEQSFQVKVYDSANFGEKLSKENIARYLEESEKLSKKVEMKIISIQSGEVTKSIEPSFKKQFEINKKNNWNEFSDYALVKIEGENLPCISTASYKKGNKVIMMAYPAFAPSIFDAKNDLTINPVTLSFGQECKFSSTSYDKQIDKLTTLQRLLSNFALKERLKEFQSIYDNSSDELIFHSALMAPAASGGGLFNEKGELIGINIEMIDIIKTPTNPNNALGIWRAEDTYAPGSYLSISINHIKEELKKQNINIEEVFDCK